MKVCQFYQFADVKSRQFADFHNLLLTFIALVVVQIVLYCLTIALKV